MFDMSKFPTAREMFGFGQHTRDMAAAALSERADREMEPIFKAMREAATNGLTGIEYASKDYSALLEVAARLKSRGYKTNGPNKAHNVWVLSVYWYHAMEESVA